MAVQRKRPSQRNRSSGKRPTHGALVAALALALAGLCLGAPARAQDDGSLGGGASAFSAGKYDSAVKQLSAALRSDSIKPSTAAKALYFRGIAYQKLGQPSRAIADLGAALWLGLSSSERVQALVNRSLAYRAAGLKREADAELSLARKEDKNREVDRLLAEGGGGGGGGTAAIAAFSTEVREEETGRRTTVPSAPPRDTEVASNAPAEAPSSGGNRVSRWWGSITGSRSEPEPEPAPSEAPAKPPAISSDWSTKTEAAPETRVAAASPTVPVGGGYLLQLSPTRSESEANALWKQVAKSNRELASLQPRIEKTDMGNLGTFYRLQIGPFPDKAESLKVCNALKRGGVDCFLVTP